MTVSLLMLTYNHEKFIAQAIDGILMQKANFKYELIIGDDCSPDGTQKIIREYQATQPDIIKPVLRTENIGANHNFVDIFHKAKGKYIALCEGDDYWTDPNKLQKQVDFLEANPEYVLCSHNGTILDEIGTGKTGEKLIKTDADFDFNTEDLLIQNRASTLTVMFRNGLIKKFPDWYTKFNGGDRSLYIILSQYGKLRHLEFDGAVYRLHYGGVSVERKLKDKNKQRYAMLKELEGFPFYLETLNEYLDYKYDKTVKKQQRKYYYRIFLYYFSMKDYKKAKEIVNNKRISLNFMKTFKDKVKFIIIKLLIISKKSTL